MATQINSEHGAGLESGQGSSMAAGQSGEKGSAARGRSRVRVMLFTDSFIHGGTERQLVQTLRLLDRDKYDLVVGCLKHRGPFLSEVEALGIPIVAFPITSLAGKDTLGWMRKLARFLREEKIDLLHSFDYYTDIFAVPAARWAGVPVVIASRRDLAHSRTALERAVLNTVCRMAHGIVANSEAAAGIGTGTTAASPKVAVIHNAVPPGEYLMFAFEEGEPVDYATAEVIRKLAQYFSIDTSVFAANL